MSSHDPFPPPPIGIARPAPVVRPPSGRPRRARWAALVLLALAPLVPCAAAALEFECSLPGDTRYLRVDLPGEEHLCEVSVIGGAGGPERRVLWYADNETLFCSAKAYELRDKYVDTWSFDCVREPDRDGIDQLSERHRAILDTQLKSLLARAADDEPGVEASGARAVASSPLPGRSSLLALQFFLADGGDLVRVVSEEEGRWRTFAELRDLAASVPSPDGLGVEAAFVDAIDGGGALDVVTLLSRDDGSFCEGRIALQASDDGTLVPITPHRNDCDGATRATLDAG